MASKKNVRKVISLEPHDSTKFITLEVYGQYTKFVIKKALVKEWGSK